MELWIARDFDGFLNLYVNKPSLDSNDNMYYVMEDDYPNSNEELINDFSKAMEE